MANDWCDKVREKLVKELEVEDFVRVIHFLDAADEQTAKNAKNMSGDGASGCSTFWHTLKFSLGNDAAFSLYARNLADDTRKADNDPAFRQRMAAVYEQMMEHSEEKNKDYKGFQLVVRKDINEVTTFMGLVRALKVMPAQSKAQVVELVKTAASKAGANYAVTTVDECMSLVSKHGGNIVMVSLAAVYLTYEAYVNLRRWWKGEISGKRCAKNLLDETAAVVSGLAGGMGGAAVGSALCPGLGTFVGGIIGSVAGANIGKILVDRLTQSIFNLPKDLAVEKAYHYLGVKPSASNAEVNSAFRRLCLVHHPDKSGSADEFLILQTHMSLVKLQRGDLK